MCGNHISPIRRKKRPINSIKTSIPLEHTFYFFRNTQSKKRNRKRIFLGTKFDDKKRFIVYIRRGSIFYYNIDITNKIQCRKKSTHSIDRIVRVSQFSKPNLSKSFGSKIYIITRSDINSFKSRSLYFFTNLIS